MDGYELIISIKGVAQPRTLQQARAVIGREKGDLVIGDPMCSSRHAELLFTNGQLTYRDLDSSNGSFIRGQRVQQVVLNPGDVVEIGDSTLQYVGPAGSGRGHTRIAPTRQPAPAPVTQQPTGAPTPMKAGTSRGALLAIFGAVVVLVIGAAVVAKVLLAAKKAASASGGLASALPSLGTGSGVASGGEATVKAVWFRNSTPPEGGTSDITVRISPNAKPGASVGVIEEFAGGTGNQWRTSTWLAAFNASRATGHSLVENEYLVRAGGHIDGPSAGMLMTATMMSLLRGKPPRADTTMTGTINPDGSAGPVGGIVQKMGGARKAGITRFGYPMGARNHLDMATRQMVDLNDVGAGLGMEVKEIHDLTEAYEFLTGDTLEQPDPISESELELPTEARQRLIVKLNTWKAKLEGQSVQLNAAFKSNPTLARALGTQIDAFNKNYEQAKTFESSDLPVAAFLHYVKASLLAVVAHDALEFMQAFVRGDLDGIQAQVEEARTVAGQVNATRDEAILHAKQKTIGGQVNATLALQSYITALAFAELGEDGKARADAAMAAMKQGKLKASNEAIGYVMQNLLVPIAYDHSARVMLEMSRDLQDILGEEGRSSSANLSLLGKEAGAFGSAAGATLAYFDALIVEDAARENGVSKARVQEAVAEKDQRYLLAVRGVSLTEGLQATDAADPRNLLRLAAGSQAYFTAAALVNQYYSLEAVPAKDGEVTIGARKALSAQLDQARLHARQSATRALKSVGFVPVSARLDFQLASAMREGSDEDKLEALEAYWSSAFWSELAAHLAQ